MRTRQLLSVCLIILAITSPVWAGPSIYISGSADELERQAAEELRRLLYAGSGSVLPIDRENSLPRKASGYVLGTPDSLPRLSESFPFGLDMPSHDGYLLHDLDQSNRLLVIAAPTPRGVLNGVFGYLEKAGFGFYLSGETLPEKSIDPKRSDAPRLHESCSPVFAMRGALPWHETVIGSASWEYDDYVAYIDQLVRMRMNLVVFHSRDTDPFTSYGQDGSMLMGEPLMNTAHPHCGSAPLPVNQYFAGTSQYFAHAHFGAASSFLEDRNASITQAKQTLRHAIAYAKTRGMRTGLGFDVEGDALAPAWLAQFEARLKAVLTDYPELDYLWLWQPESNALTPVAAPAPGSPWQAFTDQWRSSFADLEDLRRQAEATRMTIAAMAAQRVVHAVRPGIQVVVSGRGGDQWLRFTDFLPGMDALLPDDVVLAALDNIRVTPTVSESYNKLRPERTRWPIIWLEYDGDLWMPQPNLYETAGACRDAAAKGCQGILGVHWRTRSVDDTAGYMARFAWDANLSVDAFCQRRARDLFGGEFGAKLTRMLVDLQRLGYRWVGGSGQNECMPFFWGIGDPSRVDALSRMADELRVMLHGDRQPLRIMTALNPLRGAGLIPELPLPLLLTGPAQTPQRQNAIEWLQHLDYVLAYDLAAHAFLPGGVFDNHAINGETAEAIAIIQRSGLARAFQLYARNCRTKGELGVLASMNAKAWGNLRKRLSVPDEILVPLEQPTEEFLEDRRLLVLPDQVIVSGPFSEKLTVELHTRPLGARRYTHTKLQPAGRSVFNLVFPEKLKQRGEAFEYGVVVTDGRTSLQWPVSFPKLGQTRQFIPARMADTKPAAESPEIDPVTPQVEVIPERYAVRLSWETRPGVLYGIYRGDELIGVAPTGWFEDLRPAPGVDARYGVQARHVGTGHIALQYVDVRLPEFPLPSPPTAIKAGSRGGRVILGWESDAPGATQYLVARYDERLDFTGATKVDASFGQYAQYADSFVQPGEAYSYTLAAVTPDGRVGDPSPKIGVLPMPAPLKPMVQLRFDSADFLTSLAKLAANTVAVGGSGWEALPAQNAWDTRNELTLSAWVKLDDLAGMPVLICKGAWRQAGYFLQLHQNRIRFYLSGVDTLDAGYIKAGVWQHIAATYVSGQMRIFLDGQLVGEKRATGHLMDNPALQSIQRYGSNEEQYYLRGLMDDVRIYDLALTPEEIASIMKEYPRQNL